MAAASPNKSKRIVSVVAATLVALACGTNVRFFPSLDPYEAGC